MISLSIFPAPLNNVFYHVSLLWDITQSLWSLNPYFPISIPAGLQYSFKAQGQADELDAEKYDFTQISLGGTDVIRLWAHTIQQVGRMGLFLQYFLSNGFFEKAGQIFYYLTAITQNFELPLFLVFLLNHPNSKFKDLIQLKVLSVLQNL